VTNSSVGDNDKIQSTSRYKEFLLSTRLRNRFKLKDIQILPELSVQENMILTLEITRGGILENIVRGALATDA
jgi:hypothetical protein